MFRSNTLSKSMLVLRWWYIYKQTNSSRWMKRMIWQNWQIGICCSLFTYQLLTIATLAEEITSPIERRTKQIRFKTIDVKNEVLNCFENVYGIYRKSVHQHVFLIITAAAAEIFYLVHLLWNSKSLTWNLVRCSIWL